MINRRHIRVKVMQSFYALLKSNSDDIAREEKFLYFSIDKLYDLYVLQLTILVEVKKLAEKRLAISKKGRMSSLEDFHGIENIINNQFLQVLDESVSLKEYIISKNIDNWKDATEYAQVILDEIKKSTLFVDYTLLKQPTFKEDKEFIISVFKEIVAPSEKLIDYYEDHYIGWIDDLPFVNTLIVKKFIKIKSNQDILILESLYKDIDDRDFVKELFNKVVLRHTEFDADIDEKTPNWEYDRIAQLDLILIKMAITEFLFFSSIPTKVSINEYIEIAKDYSSDKSSFFINGVLDIIEKEYRAKGKIKKIGRGLI